MLPGLSQYAVLVWGATVGQNSYDVCQVVENVNPNVANSSLNSSGFSENLPNLSLQIPTSPIVGDTHSSNCPFRKPLPGGCRSLMM